MKLVNLVSITEQELKEVKLVDKVYEALLTIDGFNKLGYDEQGEAAVKVKKILEKFGLR